MRWHGRVPAARPGAVAAGLLATAAILLLGAGPAAAQTVEFAVDGIVREVPVIERQGERFVALATIARLLGGQVETVDSERVALVVDDRRLVVQRRVPYVQVDDRWYQLVHPAQKDESGFYLPVTTLDNLLPLLWPGRFPPPVSTSARPLPVGGDPAYEPVVEAAPERSGDLERVDVRVDPERTRLGFRLAAAPDLTVDDGLPGALLIHVASTEIPPAVARGLRGVGLVDSVAVVSEVGGSAVTLWLDPRASVYAVAPLRKPTGFEVVLRAGGQEEAAFRLASDVRVTPPDNEPVPPIAAHGEMVAQTDRPEPIPSEVPDRVTDPVVRTAATGEPVSTPAAAPPGPRARDAWRIVVDAGHGGRDPGSIGKGGTREKEVTLRVARALAERLEEDDVEVVLTRGGDEFIALGERTRIANREEADLFVSIHANSSENRSAEGFETYFLSAAKSEDARRVAKMENSAILYESPEIDPASLDELNFILWDLAQNEYLRESSALAETIQEELEDRLSLESRGVKQAGFFVLNGAYMPAVLFEMAFISNPREENLLNDPAFRSRMVDGLAESLLGYLDGYGRRLVAR
ncbi:MAG: N-acetylmuramoyl-L-alanine amidase family protein [Gemmatimonadota bacterium]